MSDSTTPVPVKGSDSSNRQKLMIAVLATVLVVAMLVFLVPTILGGEDASSPAPSTGRRPSAARAVTTTSTSTPSAAPVVRPSRNPFNP